MTGGEDYVLVFTAPVGAAVSNAFAEPPVRIGTCVSDPDVRTLGGVPVPAAGGWEHSWH